MQRELFLDGVMVFLRTNLIFFVGTLILISACNRDEKFLSKPVTEFAVQAYNPPLLDVLWVLDTRSNLSRKPSMSAKLQAESLKFFTRLDSSASMDYQMAFINMNADTGRAGALLPIDSTRPILHKSDGQLNDRISYFSGLFGQIINLNTSAINAGLENARFTLVNNIFQTRAKVPLVLIFISDSDDQSTPKDLDSLSKVEYYAQSFLKLKNNNNQLLRVYSINYLNDSDKCATEVNIMKDHSFVALAARLGGVSADLCESWGDTIDLSGLRLLELPKVFPLSAPANPDGIQVSIFNASGPVSIPKWQFDSSTNSIVFDDPPQDGTTLQFIYNSKSE